MTFWFNTLAFAITLVTFTVAIWLGLFLVTRAGRSLRVWLSALTVWAVGFWFVQNGLQTSLPNYDEFASLLWIGQGIKFAPTLWFHLSVHLLQETRKLSRPYSLLLKVMIALGYLLALFQVWDTGRGFGTRSVPEEIPSYGLFLVLLSVLPLWAMWNFYQALTSVRLPILRQQLLQMLIATAVAYAGGLLIGIGIYFRWNLPFFPSYAVLGVGVILLSYGVVRYDALLEGRSLERDALYSIAGVGIVTLFYTLVALGLWILGLIDLAALIAFLVCAVVTHTLSDGGRAILDRLFYRGHLLKLRADLRQLSEETGTGSTLSEQLGLVLDTICQTIGVQDGFIAIRQSSDALFVVTNSREPRWRDRQLPVASLSATEIVDLHDKQQGTRPEVESMALIVPLADNRRQHGALVLGNKISGAPFRSEDFDYLETVGPQLAGMIEAVQQQETRAAQLEQVVEEYRAREREMQQQMQQLVAVAPAGRGGQSDLDDETMTTLTEDALRHLYDYTYLGEHELAKLEVVSQFLPIQAAPQNQQPTLGTVTHVDQGKALQTLLLQVVNQLRPEGVEPPTSAVPTREWHNFLILHDSYLQGELTRDIMARLYIGEGTYNRTRRRALRSVAKTIQEMEQQVQAQAIRV